MQSMHRYSAAALGILLAGCASWFLRGAEMAGGPPASAVAVFTAPTCQSASGAMPGNQSSYHLTQEHGRWVLYEVEANGASARITNGWTDDTGVHFFAWVRNGPGWLYSFPPEASGGQPVRHVFPARSYSGDQRGGVTRPSGSPTASCPMVARAMPGTVPGTYAGTAGGQTVSGAMPGAQQTAIPGAMPGAQQTTIPGAIPGAQPTAIPGAIPGAQPAAIPGAIPGAQPAAIPGAMPSAQPPPSAPPAPAPTAMRPPAPAAALSDGPTAWRAVPRCQGNDTRGAQQAAARGRALYRRAAAAAGGPDLAGVRQALAEFDTQCASGDDWALELRASALFVLGRHVEAMDSLDAFLAAHPINTLPSDVRARVETNLPMLEERIATLRASGNTPGGMIRLNGGPWRPLDGRPLRVEPGRVRVEVSARGRTVIDATETLIAGSTITRAYDLSAAAPPAGPAPPPPRVSPAPEPPHAAINASEMARLDTEAPPGMGAPAAPERQETPVDAPATTGGGVDLIAWIATAGALGGLSLALGPVLLVLSDDQYANYLERCTGGQWHELCPTVRSESDMKLNASWALFGVGGLFAATAVTLGIIQAVVGAPAPGDAERARFTCAPGLLGLVCEGRF